jgi:GT2 family glycosyltransferase
MSVPLISVIIPTYRRIEALTICLKALTAGTLSENYYNLIVTDDSDNESVLLALKAIFPKVQFIKGPKKGPAANRNTGASFAKTDWLIFIDDDCIPDPQCLEIYYQAILSNPAVAFFEGAIYQDRPRLSLAEEAPTNREGGCFWSCNLAIKKSIFDQMNGFDTDFPYAAYEDMDFSKRLKQAGFKTQFLSQAAVCHPWRTVSGWKKFWRQRSSAMIYIKKHPDEWLNMNGWTTLKIAIGRFVQDTLPGGWRYRGRGFISACVFDVLDMLFACFLMSRSLKNQCAEWRKRNV